MAPTTSHHCPARGWGRFAGSLRQSWRPPVAERGRRSCRKAPGTSKSAWMRVGRVLVLMAWA